MMWNGRVGRTLRMLQDGMDLVMLRRRLISSNVANAETPGYKAVDVDFRRALQENLEGARVGLVRTHKDHMGPTRIPPKWPIKKQLWSEGEGRADGNTVSLEGEMAKLAENHIRFQLLTRAVNHIFATLKEAITEGGRR